VAEHLPAGTGVGIDPHVFSVDEAQALETALAAAGRQLSLIPMGGPNLVDTVWGDGAIRGGARGTQQLGEESTPARTAWGEGKKEG
jgi:hypothetical protein